MPSRGPPSPEPPPPAVKRPRASPGQSSTFRNVSACNRCRLRKNRCDQQLPSCASCAKAGVACVGYDPITKQEIPRSYVFYLETRVEQLERLVVSHGFSLPPAENLEPSSRPEPAPPSRGPEALDAAGPSRPRSLASASGVSFARVVYAAVQYSVSDAGERLGRRGSGGGGGGGGGTSMRDSFFGLHTKPTIQPAPFPDKHVGLRLVKLYFEHANPQIPILHRGEFMRVFEHAYDGPAEELAARELYLLNMVFAIGCGVIVGEPVKAEAPDEPRAKRQRRPEEYHASAIVHLESCLSFGGGGLEVLQAVLLLANFALLRPVPPGLWYITGVVLRLAVDLGLHHEDASEPAGDGRRLWTRDMRRRLWWCAYSFDRLVSTCVGRPFGISDQVVTTPLPSLLGDDCITPTGFLEAPAGSPRPSYKRVAHHYFRLRMLQSEMLQVLQHEQAHATRAASRHHGAAVHAPSPFLARFDSFRSWRVDIDRRLLEWKAAAPTRAETGVAFSTEFLELNYWQAIIMLYRQSLSVPVMFEGEYSTSDEVDSPTAHTAELREDEDRIYLKVAEAGQKILRIYRQLHLGGLVSYTYLSTHHLLMAGLSYLYAIWHSPVVRSRLSMDEVDFTVLAAKSVFTDMMDKCPPAETCRDAFDRTAKATIKMVSSSGGFGPRRAHRHAGWAAASLSPGHGEPAGSGSAPRHGLAGPERASSPSPSAAGRAGALDAAAPLMAARARGGAPGHDATPPPSSSVGPLLAPLSPPSATDLEQPDGPAGAFMGHQQQQQQQLSAAAGLTGDYLDSQTLEFLQDMGGGGPNGNGMHGLDPAQLDPGFGFNWEGAFNDYGEGQQMNPFDTFFFGGGGGQQYNVGSAPASSHGSSGGGP